MSNNLGKNKMNNNKETQTRREFFKNAAKKALPILGAVTLMSNPLFANAMESEETGCHGTCYGACVGSCDGCKYTCTGTCKNACESCKYTCIGTCKNACQGCKNTCTGTSK